MIKVGVFGLGKLGLPLAACISDCGFSTVGYDSNVKLVEKLINKEYDFIEPQLNGILSRNSEKIIYSSEIISLSTTDIVYIILPTPSLQNNAFDDSLIKLAVQELLNVWKDRNSPKTIVIVSTVMPGTCESIIKEHEIELKKKHNVRIVYSPEFIALGAVVENLISPDMILVGAVERADASDHLNIQSKLTGIFDHKFMSLREAEVTKLLVNCFVTMKISFANFIGEISYRENLDANIVSEALGCDSRIGTKYLRPGLGYSGPCFPRDNRALIKYSEDLGLNADLSISTDKINERQPDLVLEKIKDLTLQRKKIGIVGLAYKPHTTVIDESQTIKVASKLVNDGYQVFTYDPLIAGSRIVEGALDVNEISELEICDLIIAYSSYREILISQSNLENTKIIYC